MCLKLRFFFAFSPLIFACSASPWQADIPLHRLDGHAVPFSLSSGISSKKTLVVRNEEQWRQAWSLLHANRRPIPSEPGIDFDKTMAVVFALGAQKSGGFSVQIISAFRTSEVLRLVAEVRQPSRGCIVTAAITAPADVVLLPMTKKPVVVEEISVEVDC